MTKDLEQKKEVVETDKKMSELNLPHPRFIDVAVPGNLKCGEVD